MTQDWYPGRRRSILTCVILIDYHPILIWRKFSAWNRLMYILQEREYLLSAYMIDQRLRGRAPNREIPWDFHIELYNVVITFFKSIFKAHCTLCRRRQFEGEKTFKIGPTSLVWQKKVVFTVSPFAFTHRPTNGQSMYIKAEHVGWYPSEKSCLNPQSIETSRLRFASNIILIRGHPRTFRATRRRPIMGWAPSARCRIESSSFPNTVVVTNR